MPKARTTLFDKPRTGYLVGFDLGFPEPVKVVGESPQLVFIKDSQGRVVKRRRNDVHRRYFSTSLEAHRYLLNELRLRHKKQQEELHQTALKITGVAEIITKFWGVDQLDFAESTPAESSS
jgi:hypothetical protein